MDDDHKLTVGGVTLACTISGDSSAPPMLLLHALGQGRRDWAPVLARFAERYQVFAPDLRGHGDSDWPGAYTLQLMHDDVTGLADTLGLGQVTLVGHSMGGVVAYLTAISRPDLVRELILEDVPPPFIRNRPTPDRPPGQLGFDWSVVPAITGQISKGEPAIWEDIKKITAPTLLIGGGAQSHIPQDLLDVAAASIPSCELVTIAAGHNVHAERPDEFAGTVLAWLQRP